MHCVSAAYEWGGKLWCREDYEEKYHFSCQFTADLLAMNHADFIVTSTYQVPVIALLGGGATHASLICGRDGR
jgi:hypothetical protein